MCVYIKRGLGGEWDAKAAVVLHARQMSRLSCCSLGFSYFALYSCFVGYFFRVSFFSVVRLFFSSFPLCLLFNIFDDGASATLLPGIGAIHSCNILASALTVATRGNNATLIRFTSYSTSCWELTRKAAVAWALERSKIVYLVVVLKIVTKYINKREHVVVRLWSSCSCIKALLKWILPTRLSKMLL